MDAISRHCFITIVVFFALCLTGCKEGLSDKTDDQMRLVASENIELKNELAEQKGLLTDCQKNNDELKKQLNAKNEEQGRKIMEMFESMSEQLKKESDKAKGSE